MCVGEGGREGWAEGSERGGVGTSRASEHPPDSLPSRARFPRRPTRGANTRVQPERQQTLQQNPHGNPPLPPSFQVDPDLDGPTLPSAAADEFRPFARRLPEFKFWWAATRAVALGFAATFFPVLDVPVFWPILVAYFCALFFVTMKRQIKHMVKHRYVPFSLGKPKHGKGGGGAVARPVE